MTENQTATIIVDTAFQIHKALGPGLLESAYEAILASQLSKRGLNVGRQVTIPVVFEETRIELGYRADMIVENLVIVEVKTVAEVLLVHRMQLLTYLRMAEKHLGLLINFNVALIRDGISRVVNRLQEP